MKSGRTNQGDSVRPGATECDMDQPSKGGRGDDHSPAAATCAARRHDNSPCDATPQVGSRFCFFHDPDREDDRRHARQAGGRERSRPAAVLDVQTPSPPLRSVSDVTGLLSDTIHQVRTGHLDPKVANCVGYLSGILLKAIEVGQIEERLAAMEAVLRQAPGVRSGLGGDFDKALPGGDEGVDLEEHKEDV